VKSRFEEPTDFSKRVPANQHWWRTIYLFGGLLDRAQIALAIAYPLAEGDTNCRGEVASLSGRLWQVQGDAWKARQFFEEAQGTISDPRYRRFLLLNLALTNAEAGDSDEARRLLGEFQICDGDSEFLHAIALRVRGLVHRSLGEEDLALELLTHSATAFERCGDSQGFALSTLDSARLLLDRGEFQRVAVLAQEAMDVLSLLGVRGEALVAWMTFRQAAEAESLRSSALDGFRRTFLQLLLKSKFQAVD